MIEDGGSPPLRHQAALARLGSFALTTDELPRILSEACRIVGEALHTRLVRILELQPDGTTLAVRAAIGWKPELAGSLRMPAPMAGPHASAAIPIATDDTGPAYGMLQVERRAQCRFDASEMQFLRVCAGMLAASAERVRLLDELRAKAERSERLLRELQHRVKNNLMTIMGLVRRRIRQARDPEAARELRRVGDGVETLRLLYDRIYRTHAASDRTCLGTYLAELLATLLRFHGSEAMSHVRLATEIEPLEISTEFAVPFGLIATEFATNSLKYAFAGRSRGGVIGIRTGRDAAGRIRVTFWDNGKGLAVENAGGTGLRLIDGLARQMDAGVEWHSDGGTRLTVIAGEPRPDGAQCGLSAMPPMHSDPMDGAFATCD